RSASRDIRSFTQSLARSIRSPLRVSGKSRKARRNSRKSQSLKPSAKSRDLKFSFVDLGEKKFDYVGLMNHVNSLARGSNGAGDETYKSGDIPNLAAA